MRIPFSAFIYGAWGLIAAILVISSLIALCFGLRGKGNIVMWRSVKLIATITSALSIASLMFGLASVAGRGFVGEATPEHILAFVDAKFFIAKRFSLECGIPPTTAERRWICSDLSTAMDQINGIAVRDGGSLTHIDIKNRSPALRDFFESMNAQIDHVNLYAHNPDDRDAMPSTSFRITFIVLAGVLLSLSLAGSVGEAAFQYQVARNGRKLSPDNLKMKAET